MWIAGLNPCFTNLIRRKAARVNVAGKARPVYQPFEEIWTADCKLNVLSCSFCVLRFRRWEQFGIEDQTAVCFRTVSHVWQLGECMLSQWRPDVCYRKPPWKKKIIWQKSETQNLGSGTVVTEMAAKGVLSVVSSLVWTKVYSRGKLKCVVNQIASFWFPNHKCILTQGPAFWKAVFRASDQHRKCLKWHKLQQKTCDRTTQGVLKNKTCFFHEFWEKRNLSAATG